METDCSTNKRKTPSLSPILSKKTRDSKNAIPKTFIPKTSFHAQANPKPTPTAPTTITPQIQNPSLSVISSEERNAPLSENPTSHIRRRKNLNYPPTDKGPYLIFVESIDNTTKLGLMHPSTIY